MNDRIFNLGAGPGVLPEPVLKQAQQDLWNVAGSGMGVMELSHRGKVFDRIIVEAEAACRELAGIPDNYRVLFLQGGASLQFAMVPMNFLKKDATADYLVTGVWSEKTVKEAKRFGTVNEAVSSADRNFSYVPAASAIRYVPVPARSRLLQMLGSVDLRLVASGHVHQRRDFTHSRVRHVWAPSAGFVISDQRQEVIGIKEVGLVEYRFQPDSFEVLHVRAPGQTDVDLDSLLG